METVYLIIGGIIVGGVLLAAGIQAHRSGKELREHDRREEEFYKQFKNQ